MSVEWRGVPVCECMPDLLDDLAAAVGPLVTPMQGSYSSSVSASAQTHAGGGAIDLGILGWADADREALIAEARKRGLVLWHRTPAQGFVEHAHGIVDGCPHLSGISRPVNGTAKWQVNEYHAGRNGLAGRGADDGPRAWVGATWQRYRQANPKPQPKPKPTYQETDVIVLSTVPAEGGKVYLLVPGKAPKWLTPSELSYVQRLFPYWKDMPGSPFFQSEIGVIDALIQPAAPA